MTEAVSVSLHDVEKAKDRIQSSVMRTPLVELNIKDCKRKVGIIYFCLLWNRIELFLFPIKIKINL